MIATFAPTEGLLQLFRSQVHPAARVPADLASPEALSRASSRNSRNTAVPALPQRVGETPSRFATDGGAA